MDGGAWLKEVVDQYHYRKAQCERAIEQVTDHQLFESAGRIPLCLAAQMKHIGGNHRSRWRDFLTTDGEKPDRNRDSEFIVEGETPDSIREQWKEGWTIAFESLEALGPADLEKKITIRGEPHTVAEAIQRNLTHLAYHTGQIVSLALHFAGDSWQTLSIPVGRSEAYNEEMREKWGDWEGEDVATIEDEALLKRAMTVRERAYAGYSGYFVGAALVDEKGGVHVGCNVENTAFPQGSCAEANAIGAMVAAGGRRIAKIAVSGGCGEIEPCTPCGGCRQRIKEFADESTRIITLDAAGFPVVHTMDDLLPASTKPV